MLRRAGLLRLLRSLSRPLHARPRKGRARLRRGRARLLLDPLNGRPALLDRSWRTPARRLRRRRYRRAHVASRVGSRRAARRLLHDHRVVLALRGSASEGTCGPSCTEPRCGRRRRRPDTARGRSRRRRTTTRRGSGSGSSTTTRGRQRRRTARRRSGRTGARRRRWRLYRRTRRGRRRCQPRRGRGCGRTGRGTRRWGARGKSASCGRLERGPRDDLASARRPSRSADAGAAALSDCRLRRRSGSCAPVIVRVRAERSNRWFFDRDDGCAPHRARLCRVPVLVPRAEQLVRLVALLALALGVSACERGCLARRLEDRSVSPTVGGEGPRGSARHDGKPSFDLSGTDCSDGLARCSDGRVEVSVAGHVPHPCTSPGKNTERPGTCECPWRAVGSCDAGCVKDGLEVLATADVAQRAAAAHPPSRSSGRCFQASSRPSRSARTRGSRASMGSCASACSAASRCGSWPVARTVAQLESASTRRTSDPAMDAPRSCVGALTLNAGSAQRRTRANTPTRVR